MSRDLYGGVPRGAMISRKLNAVSDKCCAADEPIFDRTAAIQQFIVTIDAILCAKP